MALIDIHNLSENGEFKARFASALAHYVSVVVDEDPMTPDHAARMMLAMRVIDAPRRYADELSLSCAAKCGGQMPDDATLQAIVAGYWTVLALQPPVV